MRCTAAGRRYPVFHSPNGLTFFSKCQAERAAAEAAALRGVPAGGRSVHVALEASSDSDGENKAAAGQRSQVGGAEHRLDDDDTYRVERVLAEKNGRFLVRWAGYSAKYDTWEPEENFIDRLPITMFRQTMAGEA